MNIQNCKLYLLPGTFNIMVFLFFQYMTVADYRGLPLAKTLNAVFNVYGTYLHFLFPHFFVL